MSACISHAGEYSDHELEAEGFICGRCGVFDETLASEQIRYLRKALAEARSPERIQALLHRSPPGAKLSELRLVWRSEWEDLPECECDARGESECGCGNYITRRDYMQRREVEHFRGVVARIGGMNCDGCGRRISEPGCQYREGFHGAKVHILIPVKVDR